ncbi:MAG: hypothetical protein HC831_24920 [Chloroflexia bacterium]|nr:hypothetical protein [Chloroflexia bacterium]
MALITEGVTDQFIIKPIIENYFPEYEFRFTPIQPPVDETDKQTDFGSWVNVISLCKSKDIAEIFNYNDFLIIQIDGDVSQEKGFDVPHLDGGKQIDSKTLCNNIIRKLQTFISKEVWNKYSNKIIFSIGILSMECWLVGLVDANHNKKNTNNCIKRLNIALSKKNEKIVNPKNKNNFQSRSIYKNLAGKFRNKKTINKFSKTNVGFECFVEQLNNMIFFRKVI